MEHFGRAESVAAGHADPFLKWIEDFEADSGNVEAPTGWFALVHITRGTVADWVSQEGDPWMSERRNFTPGWYILQVNHLGFIHGWYYADATAAERDYADLDRAYGEWENSDA